MKNSAITYLALDLGASSGRAIAGTLDKGMLSIKPVNRFTNGYFELGETLYWNFIGLWADVVQSMKRCAELGYTKLAGIGVNTWGVDYGLIGSDGQLVSNPVCYRDKSTKGMPEVIASKISDEQIYKITGLAPGRVATLPQLVAVSHGSGTYRLKTAKRLLMMPGLFRYFLCGDCSVELSAAGSSLMLDIRSGKWSTKILRSFGIPAGLLPDVIKPGRIVGKLKAALAGQTGLNQAPIVAVAGHDTLSAGAAIPYIDDDCAFIICGTWSVAGQILDRPITTLQALRHGFVNEPGLESILFARNMMGLFVFEALHRSLERKGEKVSYAAMVKAASAAKPFKGFLDMNSPLFFVTADPEEDVKKFLSGTCQKVSLKKGELIRSILEGLAFSYREALQQLGEITGNKLNRICLVGGGTRNNLLCQMAADATGLEVLAGPAEATIAGNLGVQALATGLLKTPTDIRELVRRSFKIDIYKPENTQLWVKHYDKYMDIRKKSKNI
ncbi:MAG: FGGY-family carbohydrate kinase [Planctomycetota bacterium]